MSDQKAAYVEWVTRLDTEPPLDGAFYAGWRAREAEVERLHEERAKREADFEPLLDEVLRLRAQLRATQDDFDRSRSAGVRSEQEVERLKADLEMWHQHYARELIEANTENERLRALVQEHITVHHCLVCGSES